MKVGEVLALRRLLLNVVLDMLMQTLVACIIQLKEGMGEEVVWWGAERGCVVFFLAAAFLVYLFVN